VPLEVAEVTFRIAGAVASARTVNVTGIVCGELSAPEAEIVNKDGSSNRQILVP